MWNGYTSCLRKVAFPSHWVQHSPHPSLPTRWQKHRWKGWRNSSIATRGVFLMSSKNLRNSTNRNVRNLVRAVDILSLEIKYYKIDIFILKASLLANLWYFHRWGGWSKESAFNIQVPGKCKECIMIKFLVKVKICFRG